MTNGEFTLSQGIEETNKLVHESLVNIAGPMGEITSHLAGALGKGIRMKVLLGAAMNQRGEVSMDAIKIAAAIELLHLATLVHDDVIDNASSRRGVETVQSKFGQKQAVICGDYLLCMSMTLVTSVEKKESNYQSMLGTKIAGSLSQICKGEYSQLLNNKNIDLGIFDYLRIINGKTAALFYVSAYLGAIIGGETVKNARLLAGYGQGLGMIFQMLDDCKDYELSQEEILKPIGKDIAEGVITLPLILAMKKEPALRKLAFEAMDGKGIMLFRDEVCRVGGIDATWQMVLRYEKRARKALENMNPFKQEYLLGILDQTLGLAKGNKKNGKQ
jgi:heptaprenyl diphosphate synthase